MQFEKNYGIELLRSIAMIMIVIIHLLSHGGIVENAVVGSARYILLSFLESFVYCSVDVFAMITGFLMVDRSYSRSKIIKTWLQVFSYSVVLSVIVLLIHPELFSLKGCVKALVPTLFSEYWYFTAYFCMFFFIPYMNILLHRKEAAGIIATSIILLSILPTLIMQDPFKTDYGYSALWLMVCYLVGGSIKMHHAEWTDAKHHYMIVFGILGVLLWGSKFVIQSVTSKLGMSTSLGYYLLS